MFLPRRRVPVYVLIIDGLVIHAAQGCENIPDGRLRKARRLFFRYKLANHLPRDLGKKLPALARRERFNRACKQRVGNGPDYALNILTDALARCRNEDMRAVEVFAALDALAANATAQWP